MKNFFKVKHFSINKQPKTVHWFFPPNCGHVIPQVITSNITLIYERRSRYIKQIMAQQDKTKKKEKRYVLVGFWGVIFLKVDCQLAFRTVAQHLE